MKQHAHEWHASAKRAQVWGAGAVSGVLVGRMKVVDVCLRSEHFNSSLVPQKSDFGLVRTSWRNRTSYHDLFISLYYPIRTSSLTQSNLAFFSTSSRVFV